MHILIKIFSHLIDINAYLYNYDACYHSFMKFSPLACHLTKVHIIVLFRANYVLY